MSIFSLSANTLEGKPQALSAYQGNVLLVINVASKCGYTKQYAGLEKLSQEYKSRGLVVLGFPSNEFGGQEPGTAEEIRSFCSTKFSVSFPLFEKIRTKPGEGQSPVYAFLTAKEAPPKWNFHKYLVGRDGQLIRAFDSKTQPDDKDLLAALDAALAKAAVQ